MLIYLQVSVVLGDKVEIPTIQGTSIRLKLPTGAKQGDSFLLKGMGVPLVHKRERGDRLVVIKEILVPMKVTAAQKELIRELARLEHEQDEHNEYHFFHAFFEKVKDIFQ